MFLSFLLRQLRPALSLLGILTILTGIFYPLIVTGFAQLIFPRQANGSLVSRNGNFIGSTLIAQPFSSPRYFWPRPSATDYNAASSSGSNLAPTNPLLIKTVSERVAALRASNPNPLYPIPIDLVTASGSGLDPDISPAAAFYQIPRIARERNLSQKELEDLVTDHLQIRTFGFLGEPRINVLSLNLALDELPPRK